jgi:ATP-dependent Lhr-like helicase
VVIDEITKELIAGNMLELIGNELIIGIDAERLVNSRDFYAVFRTEPNFKVLHQDKPIGEIPMTAVVVVDENIFLAARIWKVMEIDENYRKITVIPANDGKKPHFPGSGMDVHSKVRERMLELLMGAGGCAALDEKATEVLDMHRESFAHYPIEDLAFDRPLVIKEKECVLYTFTSSKINRALKFLLHQASQNVDILLNEHQSCFIFAIDRQHIEQLLMDVLANFLHVDFWLGEAIKASPNAIIVSKWGIYLPLALQIKLLKSTHYDFAGLEEFLKNIRLISYGGER